MRPTQVKFETTPNQQINTLIDVNTGAATPLSVRDKKKQKRYGDLTNSHHRMDHRTLNKPQNKGRERASPPTLPPEQPILQLGRRRHTASSPRFQPAGTPRTKTWDPHTTPMERTLFKETCTHSIPKTSPNAA